MGRNLDAFTCIALAALLCCAVTFPSVDAAPTIKLPTVKLQTNYYLAPSIWQCNRAAAVRYCTKILKNQVSYIVLPSTRCNKFIVCDESLSNCNTACKKGYVFNAKTARCVPAASKQVDLKSCRPL